MTVCVHDHWSLWGTERREAQCVGDPARSTCSFRGQLMAMPSQRVAPELSLRKAFRTHTRIPAVDPLESSMIAPPPEVTIRGNAAAADAAPPVVGMNARVMWGTEVRHVK